MGTVNTATTVPSSSNGIQSLPPSISIVLLFHVQYWIKQDVYYFPNIAVMSSLSLKIITIQSWYAVQYLGLHASLFLDS